MYDVFMYGSLIMCKYELLVEVGTTLQRYWLFLLYQIHW